MAASLVMRQTTSGLGGAATAADVSNTPMNNIFDNVSFSEAAAGDTEYRAIDIHNDGDTLAVDVTVYMSSPTISPDTLINLGVSTSHLNSTLSIATESSIPSGVSFSYYEPGTELSIDPIPAGEYARVWLQRVVSAGAGNQSNDIGTIAFAYA